MRTISIVMATYNGGRYIRQQLESITAQSFLPTELIVADDRSSDDTLTIVEEFAKTAPFPVAIYPNSSRLGYRRNFMQAASLSRSDLIAFCDQDDRWYPQKLEISVEPFGDPEVLLMYHNANRIDNQGKWIGSLDEFGAPASVSSPMALGPWLYGLGFTQVFRRSIVELSRFWTISIDHNDPSEPMAHDQWFFFIASVFGKVVYNREPLAAYIQHGDNTHGVRNRRLPTTAIRFLTENRSTQMAQYARALERRAEILESASAELKGIWLDRARTAAKLNRNLSMLYQKEHDLYSASSFRQRFITLGALLKNQGYRRYWGLGNRALVKDVSLGLLVGPHLKRSVEVNVRQYG